MHTSSVVREARKRAGLTQAELADRLGVPQSTVARWERGTMAASFENVLRAVRSCDLDLQIRLVPMDESLRSVIDEHLRLTPAQRLAQNSHTVDFIEGARRRMDTTP